MQTITLTSYLKNHTQEQAAKIMGVTQGRISHMVTQEKIVYLVFDESGEIDHWFPYEPRFPGKSKQLAATG